jgi:arylsulfatase
VGWQAGWAPVVAQTITGTPGAADATTTIRGNQLPAPAPPFGGVIKDAALQVQALVGAADHAAAECPQRAADHHR